MVKNKHARRERFRLKEEQVEELLSELSDIKRQFLHQGATLIALKKAINAVPPVGGLKKFDLAKFIDERMKAEYDNIFNPPTVTAGEVEYGGQVEGGWADDVAKTCRVKN